MTGVSTVRVGIKGMGRIGREYLRFATHTEDLEVVAVNDLIDAESLAQLLRYDSTFGRFDAAVEAVDTTTLIVDGRKISVSSEGEPARLAWSDRGADIVIESTGKFRSCDGVAGHLSAGASRVLISAPARALTPPSLWVSTTRATTRACTGSFPTRPARRTASRRW